MPETTTIIGAGTMGAGIAQVAAQHGWNVRLVDVDAGLVASAIAGIGKRFDRLVEKGRLGADAAAAARARLTAATSADAYTGTDLVIEAVVEKLEVKNAVFSAALPHLKPGAILATNTSSLSVGAMGDAIGCPERVVGMHFFNPVPLMPLVEIISGERTDAALADRAFAIAEGWGKTVVRAQDTPGFIVNRVARGFYLEGLRMLSEGVAGVAEIDQALKKLGGFRMGPFELMDLVGIDVNYNVSVSVWEQLGKPTRLTPHPFQHELFEGGHFGRKTGRGAYDYSGKTPVPTIGGELQPFAPTAGVQQAVDAFAAACAAAEGDARERYIFARVLAAIVNEAALAHDQGVASAADIDTAMKKGTNYPHGPLEWAARAGYPVCGKLLAALNQSAGDDRFTPADLLAR